MDTHGCLVPDAKEIVVCDTLRQQLNVLKGVNGNLER